MSTSIINNFSDATWHQNIRLLYNVYLTYYFRATHIDDSVFPLRERSVSWVWVTEKKPWKIFNVNVHIGIFISTSILNNFNDGRRHQTNPSLFTSYLPYLFYICTHRRLAVSISNNRCIMSIAWNQFFHFGNDKYHEFMLGSYHALGNT